MFNWSGQKSSLPRRQTRARLGESKEALEVAPWRALGQFFDLKEPLPQREAFGQSQKLHQ